MRKSTFFGLTAGICIAFTANAANPAYTLDPEAGSVVKDLQTITIDFTDSQVEFYENNRMGVAVLENTTTGDFYICQEADRNTRAMTDGIAYSLSFISEDSEEAQPIVTPGEYQLTIRGMYQVVEEDTLDLEPIIANYTVKYPVAYTLDPAAGVATDLQGISLNFTDTKVAFYENSRMPIAVLENVTTGKVYNCQEADRNTRAMTDGIAYSFNFIGEDDEEAAPITEPGNYELTIRSMYLPADSLAGDTVDVDLPVITASYVINYPVSYTLTPDNGEIVTDLMTVTLEFPENKNVEFPENSRMPVAVLENTTTGKVYNCQEAERNTRAMTEGIVYSFTFIGEDDEEAAPITEPGNYVLAIRSMYLAADSLTGDTVDVDLPVITASYIINYPVSYILTPDNGANVENLMTVSLEFPENKNVEFPENSRMPVAVLENITTGKVYNCQEAERNTRAMTEGIVYNFTFIGEDDEEAAPITEPGNYVLAIRSMYLAADSLTGDTVDVDLPVITANYVINYPVEYILNPDNGADVENLMTVTLEFPNNKNVEFPENSRMPVAVLENTTTGTIYNCQEPDRDTFAETEGILYNFTFVAEDEEEATPIIEPGSYVLTIRSMYLVPDSTSIDSVNIDLPVITANYTITYPVDFILTPANKDTVEYIERVIIEFPNNTNVEFFENSQMPVAVLTEVESGTEYICETAERDTLTETDGNAYVLKFINFETESDDTIRVNGKYKLVIRALAQIVDEEPVALPIIEATYYIVNDNENGGTNAVEIIGEEEATSFNVYDFNGMTIVRNGNTSDVNNLPAGMYIINGKKVLIRR